MKHVHEKKEMGQRKSNVLVKAKYEITHGLSELGADSVSEAYEMSATPFHICSFFKRQAGVAF